MPEQGTFVFPTAPVAIGRINGRIMIDAADLASYFRETARNAEKAEVQNAHFFDAAARWITEMAAQAAASFPPP